MATINIDTENRKVFVLVDNTDTILFDETIKTAKAFPKGCLIAESGGIFILKGEK